jgi:hypothetical protein
MKTNIWGPSAWKFLHAITFAYPEDPSDEHKEAALDLFKSLRLLLPCGDCCNHYCREFEKNGVQASLGSRKELAKWLFNFHNLVNARLGKAEFEWDRVVAEFGQEDGDCTLQSYCGDTLVTESVEKTQVQPIQKSSPQPICKSTTSLHIVATILTLIAFLTVIYLIYKNN